MTIIDKEKIITNAYQDTWENRGSIRTRPRKFVDFTLKGYFFPETKQPLLLNNKIIQLGEDVKEKILLSSLYKYFNDITTLEIQLINNACSNIIYSELSVPYDDSTKLNAYTILIDEYYHVYLVKDMLIQLHNHFGYKDNYVYPISDSYNAVNVIKTKIDKNLHTIFDILAVCIFETTLVRELIEFFNTENMHPAIQYYINDHMNDEARHYNYFYNLLNYTWNKLSEEDKHNIGQHLAEFVTLYLNVESDKKFYIQLANNFLNNLDEAKAIVEDLYKGFAITPEIPIVKNVMRVLKNTNILAHPSVIKSFEQINWKI